MLVNDRCEVHSHGHGDCLSAAPLSRQSPAESLMTCRWLRVYMVVYNMDVYVRVRPHTRWRCKQVHVVYCDLPGQRCLHSTFIVSPSELRCRSCSIARRPLCCDRCANDVINYTVEPGFAAAGMESSFPLGRLRRELRSSVGRFGSHLDIRCCVCDVAQSSRIPVPRWLLVGRRVGECVGHQ